MKRLLSILLSGCLLLATAAAAGCGRGTGNEGEVTPPPDPPPVEKKEDARNLSAQEYALYNLAGTDALGRRVSIADGTKADKTRYVGLFYSVWLGQHQYMQKGIYDITKLESTPEGLEELYDVDSKVSPVDEFHFWGEPLYGYYSMSDPWVVTRHVELLTMAGIDYLCLDATNSVLYPSSTDLLFSTLKNFQDQGFAVPHVVFYTNSYSGSTTKKIYDRYYRNERYLGQSLWFMPRGEKPLLIGITENNDKASDQTKYDPSFNDFISSEMQEFFDVKESEWPNGNYNENSIPWMSWEYPQNVHNGSVAVPVAQHSHSVIYASSKHPECHRGYDNGTQEVDSDWTAGRSFQTMWDGVFRMEKNVNIDNVLVTSFNEWMAIKNNANGLGQVTFVDVFDQEYSRDIEMMKGGYNDNYYLQLVQNVRRFKMTEGQSYKRKNLAIDIQDDASLALWDIAPAKYRDFMGDALPRDFENAAGTARYTDTSHRNDIVEIRVANDASNLYFYIETAEEITAYNGTDRNWMNLLIRTGKQEASFAGYDFIVNRAPKDGTTSIERSRGGYDWVDAGVARYTYRGNLMQIAVPLSALGLIAEDCAIEFKVADHVTHDDDIMDYYVSGDSAPLGRLSYSYGL